MPPTEELTTMSKSDKAFVYYLIKGCMKNMGNSTKSVYQLLSKFTPTSAKLRLTRHQRQLVVSWLTSMYKISVSRGERDLGARMLSILDAMSCSQDSQGPEPEKRS